MAFTLRDGKFIIGSDGAFSTNEDCCCGANPCNCTTYVMPVASITRSGTTATVTTTDPHHLNVGQNYGLTIAGAVETAYNGGFGVTVTSATQFTYTVAGSPSTPATGTITATLGNLACTHCSGSVCTPALWTLAPSGLTLCEGCVDFQGLFGNDGYFSWPVGVPDFDTCVLRHQTTACRWQRLDQDKYGKDYSNSSCTTPSALGNMALVSTVVKTSTEITAYTYFANSSRIATLFYARESHSGCSGVTLTNQVTGDCGEVYEADGFAGYVIATGGTMDVTPCCDEEGI